MTPGAAASERQALDRDTLIRQSAQLFRERGYHATSMHDIAERVGILKGSLYHHISSKEELLVAMLMASVTEVLAEVEAAVAGVADPRRKLHLVIETQIVAMARHQDEILVWLAERQRMRQVLAEVEKRAAAIDGVLLATLEEGVAAGVWSPADVPLAYQAIRGMIAWFPSWYRPGGRLTPQAIAAQLAEFAERLLAGDGKTRKRGSDDGNG